MTNPNDTVGGSDLDVHRLLDQAFAGVEMTPERQDRKEEVRANLVARAAGGRTGVADRHPEGARPRPVVNT